MSPESRIDPTVVEAITHQRWDEVVPYLQTPGAAERIHRLVARFGTPDGMNRVLDACPLGTPVALFDAVDRGDEEMLKIILRRFDFSSVEILEAVKTAVTSTAPAAVPLVSELLRYLGDHGHRTSVQGLLALANELDGAPQLRIFEAICSIAHFRLNEAHAYARMVLDVLRGGIPEQAELLWP